MDNYLMDRLGKYLVYIDEGAYNVATKLTDVEYPYEVYEALQRGERDQIFEIICKYNLIELLDDLILGDWSCYWASVIGIGEDRMKLVYYIADYDASQVLDRVWSQLSMLSKEILFGALIGSVGAEICRLPIKCINYILDTDGVFRERLKEIKTIIDAQPQVDIEDDMENVDINRFHQAMFNCIKSLDI